MKAKCAVMILATVVLCTANAEPQRYYTRCPACKGERSLSLTPPNLGQHDGDIGVTPNKPFKSHRWDVKHERCPLCNGTGRHVMWRIKAQPPEDRADKEVCTTCWWSGVEPCRKCNHTGYVECPKCKYGRNGSKPGWIVEKLTSPTRTSFTKPKQKKIEVKACTTCGGLGKIVCPECEGLGGKPCKRCMGIGYKQKRGK